MNRESELYREQLKALGITKGDVLLVHSSMKALKTKRTPEEVIRDIQEVLTPEGTLMIPTLTYDNVNSESPVFDVIHTEPCMGLVPTRFLKMDGVVRSMHPTSSIAVWGANAKEFAQAHILDETPVGSHSPIMQLPRLQGKILFIGKLLHKCTFMHGVEEVVGAPYCLNKETTHYILKDENGETIERDLYAHNFYGWGAEYQRIKKILAYPDIKEGKLGEADCFIIDAKCLFEKAKEKFKEAPYYFVTDISAYI